MQDTGEPALDLSFGLQLQQTITPAGEHLLLGERRLHTHEAVRGRTGMLLLGLRAITPLEPLVEALLPLRNQRLGRRHTLRTRPVRGGHEVHEDLAGLHGTAVEQMTEIALPRLLMKVGDIEPCKVFPRRLHDHARIRVRQLTAVRVDDVKEAPLLVKSQRQLTAHPAVAEGKLHLIPVALRDRRRHDRLEDIRIRAYHRLKQFMKRLLLRLQLFLVARALKEAAATDLRIVTYSHTLYPSPLPTRPKPASTFLTLFCDNTLPYLTTEKQGRPAPTPSLLHELLISPGASPRFRASFTGTSRRSSDVLPQDQSSSSKSSASSSKSS